ncbi:MAG: peptidyl-prolyl cis-trans isomerase B (cyclophilin B) [Planctomycetota bacterium]|jgi:peptidyl-prolyl cis-trans isomerase B (cyclophilin B)
MSASNERVLIETDAGNMTVELFHEKTPGHASNFIKLARQGFYDGTRFHRVLSGFMIQGGDPNTKDDGKGPWGTGGPGYQIDAEFNDIHHERGILSMARSQDVNSAGSQFFVVHGEAGFLDNQYTAFGRVLEGLDTLDTIADAPVSTGSGGERSKPKKPIQVTRMTVVAGEETN